MSLFIYFVSYVVLSLFREFFLYVYRVFVRALALFVVWVISFGLSFGVSSLVRYFLVAIDVFI